MAYNRQYQAGVGWQNEPSVATPINATNLNQMDDAIIAVDTEAARAIGVHDDSIDDLYDRLEDKQDTLIFDDHPVLGSSKPVTSDGIYRAILESGGGGGGDVFLDEVYLIGLDNMPSYVSPALTINTVERIFDKDKPEYLLFRFGRMAQASGWSGGQTITLNVNNTGDFEVKKNHITQTTDTWTIKKEVLYVACINQSAGPSGAVYYWDFFEVPFDAAGNYDILPITHGGTGNALGYIRTGQTANTTAGTAATAEGADNTIRGNYSHAEGQLNSATGNYSHVGGYYNVAGYQHQTVIGRFNDNQMTTLFEVGNGQSDFYRSNAFEVYTTGDVKLSGSLYVGTTIYDRNNNAIAAVEGNPSGTATTPLSKIKIDGTIFSVGLPSDPLSTAKGGTGNADGYIRTGLASGETAGTASTAEGYGVKASGNYSHAEGYATQAIGNYSHVNGQGVTVSYSHQTAIGKYNSNKSTTLLEVGNGTSSTASNALEVYSNGAISTDNGTTKIRFGQDSNGNYGYIKDGADTVIPFKNPTGTKSDSYNTNGTYTVDVTNYASHSITIAVPTSANLQSKSQTVTPGASWSSSVTNSVTINPDSGYDGLSSVSVSTPMVRDNNVFLADGTATPSTVYNGDTSQSNTEKLLRIHPQKAGMVYTGSVLYVKANSYFGDATAADVVAGKTFSSASGILVTGTYSGGGGTPHTYGASWGLGTSASWTRSDEASGVSDPMSYSGAASYSTVKSFFDSRMPWAGMRRVNVSAVGELIEIPKFWYKWTRTSSAMKLQISDAEQTGFLVSPAHADRGDGVGERDYVYVGRYHCNSSYKSVSGYTPLGNKTRAEFRTGIHNLNANAWQQDFAMWWTIRMLYLVEHANWNSQTKIGYGCGNGTGIQAAGLTDTMPYHTGTMASSKTSYHAGVQYRGIEAPWCNIAEWVDGIYASGNNVYCIKNPANFSDTTGGTYVGTKLTTGGNIKSWSNPSSVSGFEYALIPATQGGSETQYCCDYWGVSSGSTCFLGGGNYGQNLQTGFFQMFNVMSESDKNEAWGARLMYLPSSQVI